MRQKLTIALIGLIGLLVAGCTRHNGDIGDYFGEWRLEKMTADGVELPLYSDKDGVELYTWAFQGKLIQINVLMPRHEGDVFIGSWREDGDILEINYSYHGIDDDTHNYRPPEALHLVSGGITRLHIDRMKDWKMVLSQVADDGVTYVYYLRKPV